MLVPAPFSNSVQRMPRVIRSPSKPWLLALLVLGALAPASMGDILYQQSPHTPGAAGGGGPSCFEGTLAPATSPMYDREVADDFVVPVGPGWSITQVYASMVQNTTGDLNPVTGADIKFFDGTGGSVGALVASATVLLTTRTAGPGTYFGRPEQILTFDISPINLGAGTYFLQIQPQVNHNWFWLTSTPTTPIVGSPAQNHRGVLTSTGNDTSWPANWTPSGPGNTTFPNPSGVNFTLEGSVIPAPGALALLGLAGLAGSRRRRK